MENAQRVFAKATGRLVGYNKCGWEDVGQNSDWKNAKDYNKLNLGTVALRWAKCMQTMYDKMNRLELWNLCVNISVTLEAEDEKIGIWEK